MGDRSILRQLKRLEKVFAAVEPEDDWIDVLMWDGLNGGVFGHVHCRFSESRGQSEWVRCSDEEEIAVMRGHYEKMEHKPPGSEETVSFAEFLEYYSYLGPEGLEPRRKKIIEELKEEERRSQS